MRIKKKQIIEAADTSSTTGQQTAKPETQSTNPEEIEKVTNAVKELGKEMEKNPITAFLTKLDENTSGDIDDFTSDAMDAMADKSEKNREDYDLWLQTPKGQEYIKSLESLQESINLKNKKVIKTIKVKDLK
jgi:hypothetical protein